jgi:hypothetical protein
MFRPICNPLLARRLELEQLIHAARVSADQKRGRKQVNGQAHGPAIGKRRLNFQVLAAVDTQEDAPVESDR